MRSILWEKWLGVLVLILGAVLYLNVSQVRAEAGVLDGKVFVGEMGEKGKPGEAPEELSFKDGKVFSRANEEYGFGEGAYKTTIEGDVIAFQADTFSATEGKAVWKGTVKGDALETTLLWVKEGQPDMEYWVKAKLKKA